MGEKERDICGEIQALIEECVWRSHVYDIDVCTGMAGSCTAVIGSGKCPTISEYYEKLREEAENE